jgi:hypothetical protein
MHNITVNLTLAAAIIVGITFSLSPAASAQTDTIKIEVLDHEGRNVVANSTIYLSGRDLTGSRFDSFLIEEDHYKIVVEYAGERLETCLLVEKGSPFMDTSSAYFPPRPVLTLDMAKKDLYPKCDRQ